MKVLRPTTIPFPNSGQFIRNSDATYVEDGLVKTALGGEPRWQDGVLFLEEPATNFILRSAEFDNAYWTKAALTVSANSTTDPSGSFLADKLQETTANADHRVSSSFTPTVDTTYTFSCYLKAAERTFAFIGLNAAYNVSFLSINLTTGTISTANGTQLNSSIEFIGNGWYRVSITSLRLSGVSFECDIRTSLDGVWANRSYTGTAGSGILVWGAQLEIGDSVTSYIPTVGAVWDRRAEICVGNFSRASSAYYFDNSGIMQSATVNSPRVQNNRLLIESASTNFLLNSNDLVFWTDNGATFLGTPIQAPDGSSTGRELTSPGSRSQATDTVVAGTYTCSLFIKPFNPTDTIRLELQGTALTETTFVEYSVPGLSVVTTSGAPFVSSSITALLTGWYRVSITAQLNAGVCVMHARPVGLGRSGYWGGQVEVGNSVTSYISSAGTPATRDADIHTAGLVYTNAVDARALWSSGTSYSTGQIIRYNNTVYESLQNANLNRQPDTSPTWWLSLGADNISACFDNKVGSKTTASNKLRMIVYAGTNVDSVGYIDTNAILVNTSAVDSNLDIVYSNSTGVSAETIANWYDYFFVSPLADPANQVVHQNINSIDPGLFLAIEMIRPGTVEVGSVLTGLSTTLGFTQYGLKAGIVDYSRKEADEFGNISIVERPFSKRMQGDVYVNNFDLNKVQRFLYNIRATPVLWMASDNPELAEVSYVYGFYKDFSTTIAYPDMSMCSLEIEGLT